MTFPSITKVIKKTTGNSNPFKIKTPFKQRAFFFLTLHFSGDICHQIMELYLSGSIYLLIKTGINFQALHFQV